LEKKESHRKRRGARPGGRGGGRRLLEKDPPHGKGETRRGRKESPTKGNPQNEKAEKTIPGGGVSIVKGRGGRFFSWGKGHVRLKEGGVQ